MEIKLGGNKGLSTFVDDDDYRTFRLWEYKWHPTGKYPALYVEAKKNGEHISMHRLILGLLDAPRSVYVDHIDHDGLNNCRNNLRATDSRGNQRNARKHLWVSNTTSYKGITWDSNNKSKPWRAQIGLSGKVKFLGNYRTETEAARAYNQAVTELFGPMAHLNDLPDQ